MLPLFSSHLHMQVHADGFDKMTWLHRIIKIINTFPLATDWVWRFVLSMITERIKWDRELCSFINVPVVWRCSDPLSMITLSSSYEETDTTVAFSTETIPCKFCNHLKESEAKFVVIQSHANDQNEASLIYISNKSMIFWMTKNIGNIPQR